MTRRTGATSDFPRPEYAFLAIGLLFGLMLIFVNPPFQSNDEDRHFYNSYFVSTGQVLPRQQGDMIGGSLPVSVLDISAALQGIAFANGTKVSEARLRDATRVPLAPAQQRFYNNPNYDINPAPYLPFVTGIWMGRALDASPIGLLRFARFMGLLTFLALVFMAIRVMPVHKYVLLAVALTPTTLFQATSITYDVASTALGFLIVALCVSFALREAPLSNRELGTLILLAVLHRFAKNGYFLIPFLYLLIPLKNVGSRLKWAGVLFCLIVAAALPTFTWDPLLASLQLHGGQIFQKDFYFSPSEQLALYKDRPLELVGYLFENLRFHGRAWIAGAMGRFGYSYVPLPDPAILANVLALLAISALDADPRRSLSVFQKVVVLGVGGGTAVAIVLGFFLTSPLGAHVIFGLQGRYFVPVLPVLLLLNHNRSLLSPGWQRARPFVVPAYSIVMLGYTVSFLSSYFWMR